MVELVMDDLLEVQVEMMNQGWLKVVTPVVVA